MESPDIKRPPLRSWVLTEVGGLYNLSEYIILEDVDVSSDTILEDTAVCEDIYLEDIDTILSKMEDNLTSSTPSQLQTYTFCTRSLYGRKKCVQYQNSNNNATSQVYTSTYLNT